MAEVREVREVPGYPGYFASRDGRIYKNDKGEMKELKQYEYEHTGYLLVSMKASDSTRVNTQRAHRIIAATWLAPGELDQIHVNHKDNIRSNNHVDNLEWCTEKENSQHYHKQINPKMMHGAANPLAKLDDNKVRAIRRSGGTYEEIAFEFGISKATVGKIKNRQLWGHVEDLPGEEHPRGFAKGKKHYKAKFTEDDIRAIRASTLSHVDLAHKYGVEFSAIFKIRNRITWKHVED